MKRGGWQFQDNTQKAEEALRAAIRNAVEETAYDLLEEAQKRAPVDTGALRASIHPVFVDSAGYNPAVVAARQLGSRKYKDMNARILPERGIAPQSQGELCAAVDVAVSYGHFLEFGAFNVRANRQMPAQPFLRPAVAAVRPKFERWLQKALGIKLVRVPRAEPSEDEKLAIYHRYMARGVTQQYRQDKADQWEKIRSSQPETAFQRLKLGVKGADDKGRAKYHYETFGEMWERLRNSMDDISG